jgi:hypothetical protein
MWWVVGGVVALVVLGVILYGLVRIAKALGEWGES